MQISRNIVNGRKSNNDVLVGIRAIVCVQKLSHHFLQTLHPLRMFKIVFRNSSLYPMQLSLFCLLRLISANADRIGYITNFCSMIELLHELRNSFFQHRSIQKFDNVSAGKKENWKFAVLLYITKNWRFSCVFPRAFWIRVQFCKIQFCKPGCAPADPTAHLLSATARIRQNICAASFCSCNLLGRRDECVLLPCFNAQAVIFAVMNCCVVALIVFSSDILAWSVDSVI